MENTAQTPYSGVTDTRLSSAPIETAPKKDCLCNTITQAALCPITSTSSFFMQCYWSPATPIISRYSCIPLTCLDACGFSFGILSSDESVEYT